MSFGRGLIPLFSWPQVRFEDLENEFGSLAKWPNLETLSHKDIQIESDDSAIYVTVPAPGFENSEIDISLHNGTLYIKAEHKEEKKEKTKNRKTLVQSSRSYSRIITLPEQVDEKNVSATTENGMLTIQLPKITKVESVKIPIKKKSS